MNSKIFKAIGVISIYATCAYGQGTSEEHDQASSPRHGAFIYGDWFQYVGAGPTGQFLASAETSTDRFFAQMSQYYYDIGYEDISEITPTAAKPSGSLFGGTVGYSFNLSKGDTVVIQGGFRSGKIDYSSPATPFDGRKTNSIENDNIIGTMSRYYQQDNREFRLVATWYPRPLRRSLALSFEYLHSSYDGMYALNYAYVIKPDPTQQSAALLEKLLTSSTTNDILVHATLRSPALTLFKTRTGALGMTPRVDFGFGRSIRSAKDVIDQYYIDGALIREAINRSFDSTLAQDAWVFEATATLGLYYQISAAKTGILEAGYRTKSDIDDRYGTEQSGIYARVGYTCSW